MLLPVKNIWGYGFYILCRFINGSRKSGQKNKKDNETLRNFGLTLMAILLCVNFTSCSNDDEPSSENLVGEWILVHYKDTWDGNDGKGSEEYSYDFDNYDDDSEKIIIREGDKEGTYEVKHYTYSEYEEDWTFNYTEKMRLDGKKLIPLNDDNSYDDEAEVSVEIVSVSSDKLVIKGTYKEDGETEIEEYTYKKK